MGGGVDGGVDGGGGGVAGGGEGAGVSRTTTAAKVTATAATRLHGSQSEYHCDDGEVILLWISVLVA